MNICVFCSAEEVSDTYAIPVKKLVQLLAEKGHGLVWGASESGLMKVVADEMRMHNRRLVGITFSGIKHEAGVARSNTETLIVTRTLPERKTLMLEYADTILVLPGGIGTLDELMDVLEKKRHGIHTKPIIIFNVDGFYSSLQSHLANLELENFLHTPLETLASFVDTAEEAIFLLEKQKADGS